MHCRILWLKSLTQKLLDKKSLKIKHNIFTVCLFKLMWLRSHVSYICNSTAKFSDLHNLRESWATHPWHVSTTILKKGHKIFCASGDPSTLYAGSTLSQHLGFGWPFRSSGLILMIIEDDHIRKMGGCVLSVYRVLDE